MQINNNTRNMTISGSQLINNSDAVNQIHTNFIKKLEQRNEEQKLEFKTICDTLLVISFTHNINGFLNVELKGLTKLLNSKVGNETSLFNDEDSQYLLELCTPRPSVFFPNINVKYNDKLLNLFNRCRISINNIKLKSLQHQVERQMDSGNYAKCIDNNIIVLANGNPMRLNLQGAKFERAKIAGFNFANTIFDEHTKFILDLNDKNQFTIDVLIAIDSIDKKYEHLKLNLVTQVIEHIKKNNISYIPNDIKVKLMNIISKISLFSSIASEFVINKLLQVKIEQANLGNDIEMTNDELKLCLRYFVNTSSMITEDNVIKNIIFYNQLIFKGELSKDSEVLILAAHLDNHKKLALHNINRSLSNKINRASQGVLVHMSDKELKLGLVDLIDFHKEKQDNLFMLQNQNYCNWLIYQSKSCENKDVVDLANKLDEIYKPLLKVVGKSMQDKKEKINKEGEYVELTDQELMFGLNELNVTRFIGNEQKNIYMIRNINYYNQLFSQCEQRGSQIREFAQLVFVKHGDTLNRLNLLWLKLEQANLDDVDKMTEDEIKLSLNILIHSKENKLFNNYLVKNEEFCKKLLDANIDEVSLETRYSTIELKTGLSIIMDMVREQSAV